MPEGARSRRWTSPTPQPVLHRWRRLARNGISTMLEMSTSAADLVTITASLTSRIRQRIDVLNEEFGQLSLERTCQRVVRPPNVMAPPPSAVVKLNQEQYDRLSRLRDACDHKHAEGAISRAQLWQAAARSFATRVAAPGYSNTARCATVVGVGTRRNGSGRSTTRTQWKPASFRGTAPNLPAATTARQAPARHHSPHRRGRNTRLLLHACRSRTLRGTARDRSPRQRRRQRQLQRRESRRRQWSTRMASVESLDARGSSRPSPRIRRRRARLTQWTGLKSNMRTEQHRVRHRTNNNSSAG